MDIDPPDDLLRIEIGSPADLRDWLLANHAQAQSVWLVTWKKRPGAPHVTTTEVLDELIAFGWIDGIRRKLDAARTMQLISPRKQRAWAQSYKDRAARLEALGRMHPAGRAAITAAQEACLWDATAAVDALVIPDDLAAALTAAPPAETHFTACPPSYRRNVLRWLHAARRPATRAARIAAIAAASARAARLPQM
jgi:uncharacterized protein YdeI (YjbR/CyaY-like superfamily)